MRTKRDWLWSLPLSLLACLWAATILPSPMERYDRGQVAQASEREHRVGGFRDWIYRWRHRNDPRPEPEPQPDPIPPDPTPIPPNPTPEPPGPQPPLPVPVPLPPNPPIPTTLIGIVVEESSQRTAAQAVVVLSPKTAGLFRGGAFRVVDAWEDDGSRRDLGPTLKLYVDRVEALKIKPALVVVAPDGGIHYEGPLPAKVADVEVLVSKIRKGGQP